MKKMMALLGKVAADVDDGEIGDAAFSRLRSSNMVTHAHALLQVARSARCIPHPRPSDNRTQRPCHNAQTASRGVRFTF